MRWRNVLFYTYRHQSWTCATRRKNFSCPTLSCSCCYCCCCCRWGCGVIAWPRGTCQRNLTMPSEVRISVINFRAREKNPSSSNFPQVKTRMAKNSPICRKHDKASTCFTSGGSLFKSSNLTLTVQPSWEDAFNKLWGVRFSSSQIRSQVCWIQPLRYAFPLPRYFWAM